MSECPTCGQAIHDPKPLCPECNGRGNVTVPQTNGCFVRPCSKGCPPAYLVNWADVA